MKWIVIWTVLHSFIIPCGGNEPSYDEYGRRYTSDAYTLEVCYDYSSKYMRKVFASKKEAVEFIATLKEINHDWDWENQIRDIELIEPKAHNLPKTPDEGKE